jgi:hypothetical protein
VSSVPSAASWASLALAHQTLDGRPRRREPPRGEARPRGRPAALTAQRREKHSRVKPPSRLLTRSLSHSLVRSLSLSSSRWCLSGAGAAAAAAAAAAVAYEDDGARERRRRRHALAERCVGKMRARERERAWRQGAGRRGRTLGRRRRGRSRRWGLARRELESERERVSEEGSVVGPRRLPHRGVARLALSLFLGARGPAAGAAPGHARLGLLDDVPRLGPDTGPGSSSVRWTTAAAAALGTAQARVRLLSAPRHPGRMFPAGGGACVRQPRELTGPALLSGAGALEAPREYDARHHHREL